MFSRCGLGPRGLKKKKTTRGGLFYGGAQIHNPPFFQKISWFGRVVLGRWGERGGEKRGGGGGPFFGGRGLSDEGKGGGRGGA